MSVRIVIVAQHAEFQHLLAQVIRHLAHGYEVVGSASQVEEALALFDILKPDIALVDAELAEGSGLDIVIAVRRRALATTVIVLGRTDDPEYRLAALAAGAAGYISKMELVATLPAAIRSARPPAA